MGFPYEILCIGMLGGDLKMQKGVLLNISCRGHHKQVFQKAQSTEFAPERAAGNSVWYYFTEKKGQWRYNISKLWMKYSSSVSASGPNQLL